MDELARVKKQLADTRMILEDLLQERGARPEVLRLVEVIQGDDNEAKQKLASDMLDSVYRGWVDGEVESLIDAIASDEGNDAEGLYERMRENTDSSLIYTRDQHMVIFCSNSVAEGASEMQDMGGGGDNATAVLALLTYQIDVRGAMEQVGLVGGRRDWDREEWLDAARSGEYGEEIQKQVGEE